MYNLCTVEPPVIDTLNNEHLSMKEMWISNTNVLVPTSKGHLYNMDALATYVCLEAPLYMFEPIEPTLSNYTITLY